MSFVDSLLKLSAAQQITADAVSTNTFDTTNTAVKRKIAVGEPMALVISITAKGTNSGSAKFQAIQSAAADLSSPQIIGEVDLATADIVVGKKFIIPLGQGPAALRYLGANYDITGTVDFTVDTYITPLSMASTDPENYPKGYTVTV